MFVVAQPGWKGFDAAFPPPIATILASGMDFMSCYVGGNYDQRDLGVKLAANGMPISWNYERSDTAWTGGYATGRSYAINALDQLHAIGWNNDTPCIFSLYDSTVTDYPTGFAAARGVLDVFQDTQCGFYGEQEFLASLSVQSWLPDDCVLWQWMNNGPTFPYATIRQTGHGTMAGAAIDNNLVKKPVPMWTGPGKEPPVMANQVDTLAYIRNSAGAVKAVMDDGTARDITGDEFYGARGRQLSDAHQVDDTVFANWPRPSTGGNAKAAGSFTITGTVSGGGVVE